MEEAGSGKLKNGLTPPLDSPIPMLVVELIGTLLWSVLAWLDVLSSGSELGLELQIREDI